MNMTRAEVQACIRGRLRPNAVPRRCKPGTGAIATHKRWLAEMALAPGIFLHLRTVTESNSGGSYWARAERVKSQRETAWLATLSELRRKGLKLPVEVTLTRYGAKRLDSDNYPSALKHVRDGVADAFGVDDADGSGIVWVYGEQVIVKGGYGVRILIKETT